MTIKKSSSLHNKCSFWSFTDQFLFFKVPLCIVCFVLVQCNLTCLLRSKTVVGLTARQVCPGLIAVLKLIHRNSSCANTCFAMFTHCIYSVRSHCKQNSEKQSSSYQYVYKWWNCCAFIHHTQSCRLSVCGFPIWSDICLGNWGVSVYSLPLKRGLQMIFSLFKGLLSKGCLKTFNFNILETRLKVESAHLITFFSNLFYFNIVRWWAIFIC